MSRHRQRRSASTPLKGSDPLSAPDARGQTPGAAPTPRTVGGPLRRRLTAFRAPLRVLRGHGRLLLAAGLVATLAFGSWARRGDLAAFHWALDPAALAAAVALLAVPGLVQAATFVVALRRVGAEAAWRPALRV